MRIGILTFCNAYNLGAALQAFSLQKTLEKMGNDAELIDYRCQAIEDMHKLRPVFKTGIGFKLRVYNLIYNIIFYPRRIRYKKFQKIAKRSKLYSSETIKLSNGKYDIFITGSDQVFNLKLTGNDSTYFLDFVERGKKASYAASLGVYLEDKTEQYKKELQTFDYLSVREKSAAVILEQKLGVKAEIMPDPVFLHTGDEWKKLLCIKEKKKEKYVLIYSLIENKVLYEIADSITNEKGIKTYVITKAMRPLGKSDKYMRNTGPEEFLGLIANAEYVVTNSFHGTAFSLIFKKQFTTVMPDVAPERIRDLLTFVGAEDRIFTNETETNKEIIDYSDIENKIISMKTKAIKFLGELLA